LAGYEPSVVPGSHQAGLPYQHAATVALEHNVPFLANGGPFLAAALLQRVAFSDPVFSTQLIR